MMINAMLGAATGAVLRVWANALSKQRFFYSKFLILTLKLIHQIYYV